MAESQSTDALRLSIAIAIRELRAEIRWKPGKAEQHLAKRVRRGHLIAGSSLVDYEQIIKAIISNNASQVYRYDFGGTNYGVARGTFAEREWIVIFATDGILETAFPPKEPGEYIARRGFELLGTVEEVLT